MAYHGFAFDRVRFTTATTGTGTITVGSAVSGFRTPAGASVPNGKPCSFFILDGTDWEDSTGVYTVSGTTLTRVLRESSTGALLNLSGSAVVVFTPGKDDFDRIYKYDPSTGTAFMGGAGNLTATAGGCLGVGQGSLGNLTTGDNNVGFGFGILSSNTTGGYNTAVGAAACSANITGAGNVAIGAGALSGASNTAANFNIAIGYYAGYTITSGFNNTIIGGSDTTNGPTSGSNNILIGFYAGLADPTASYQICIGNLIMATGANGTGTTYNGKAGIGTPAPDRRLHVEEETATTNAVTYLFRVTSLSSGTPAVNIGVGMEFEIETAAGNNEVGATVEAKAVGVGSGTEIIVLDGKQMAAGALQDSFGIGFHMRSLTANAAYTNNTSAQSWFPGGGAFTVEASTAYEFEGHLLLTTGSTTHTTAIGFALATATIASIGYLVDLTTVAANAVAAAGTSTYITQATSTVLNATSTGINYQIRVRGIVRFTAAGTFTPQFTFSGAPGAGNVLANSFFKLRKIGTSTGTVQGAVT